jgi:hypothetical protein
MMAIVISACQKSDDREDCCSLPPLTIEADGARLYLPNAFTPNGDGINDVLIPASNANVLVINDFRVRKNGETLFQKTDSPPNHPAPGWNGANAAGQIQDGVFDYTISFTTKSGKTLSAEGRICCRPSYPMPCVDNETQCTYGTQHDGAGGFDSSLPTWERCE